MLPAQQPDAWNEMKQELGLDALCREYREDSEEHYMTIGRLQVTISDALADLKLYRRVLRDPTITVYMRRSFNSKKWEATNKIWYHMPEFHSKVKEVNQRRATCINILLRHIKDFDVPFHDTCAKVLDTSQRYFRSVDADKDGLKEYRLLSRSMMLSYMILGRLCDYIQYQI